MPALGATVLADSANTREGAISSTIKATRAAMIARTRDRRPCCWGLAWFASTDLGVRMLGGRHQPGCRHQLLHGLCSLDLFISLSWLIPSDGGGSFRFPLFFRFDTVF